MVSKLLFGIDETTEGRWLRAEEQRVDIVGAFIGGDGFKASANAE
ncbi:hypothetical protein [Leisingera sp.]